MESFSESIRDVRIDFRTWILILGILAVLSISKCIELVERDRRRFRGFLEFRDLLPGVASRKDIVLRVTITDLQPWYVIGIHHILWIAGSPWLLAVFRRGHGSGTDARDRNICEDMTLDGFGRAVSLSSWVEDCKVGSRDRRSSRKRCLRGGGPDNVIGAAGIDITALNTPTGLRDLL